MIELQDVRKVFAGPKGEEVVAVDGVSFQVGAGETLCLIGTSGSGKTTTMKMINRLIEPTSGRIQVGGTSIQDLDVIALRRRIGYVIQKGGLFPHMTVARNVGLLCELEGWPRDQIARRTAELLGLVDLPPETFAERYPRELSGGQRQRVGVVRALALDPDYVLMDEPFGALDPITREQIHEEFKSLKERVQKTIIIVTHDMAEAFELGDRIALMDGGRLVQVGTEDDFRQRPAGPFVEEFLKSHLASPTAAVEARDALDPGAAVLPVAGADEPLAGLARGEGALPLVVVDTERRLLGLLPREALGGEGTVGSALARSERALPARTPLREALAELVREPAPLLPVTDEERRVLGAVTSTSLLARV